MEPSDVHNGLVRVVYRLVFPAGFCWGLYHLFCTGHEVDTKQPEQEAPLSREVIKLEHINETCLSWAQGCGLLF